MRNELKSALVVLAVAAVSNVWAGPKPLPKPITDAMAKFENALKWNSPVALRNLVFEYSMPEYTSTMMGQKLDLYGEVENTIMFGKMIEKVKKGGVGTWGQVPMPPNAAVKDEDIKTLVKWVLSGAPVKK